LNTKTQILKTFTQNLPGAATKGVGEIYFQHLNMDGLKEMNAYSMDERLYEYFEFDPFTSIVETEAYLSKLLNRMSPDIENHTSHYWFVRRNSDDGLIGTACLVGLDYDRRSIEMGYGIDPNLWGKGYVLQIHEALKAFVFEELKLNRLWGITMSTNRRVIESVCASGFLHEGTSRDYYQKNGVYIDGWRYAMTLSDYMSQITGSKKKSSPVSLEQIIDVVAAVLEYEVISSESSIENTASWDSLSHMEIILALKNDLLINLLPSEIAKATSIENIFEIVQLQA
jgi:RimJ/RimL family protein N-acetyltransferase/acyl carrier protein